MPGKKKNHWSKATAHQRHRRGLADEKQGDLLTVLKTKVVERALPPRLDIRDSRGQPISLPEVSILKERR